MTDDDATLIRDSFAQLHRRKAETARIFYDRLFEIAPETRVLFKTDMETQGAKLMELLFVAVASIRDREGLTMLLELLGRRHRGYKVIPADFAHVGAALLWTLQTMLGTGFTPDVERVWTALYADLSETMIRAPHAA